QWLGHAQAAGQGMRAVPEAAARFVFQVGAHHRLAAIRLHGDHLGAPAADPAELLHFVESLPHTDHAHATTGGIEDRVRQLPAHLLGHFVPHRLLAFDAVRLLERADVEPALFGALLGHHAAAIG